MRTRSLIVAFLISFGLLFAQNTRAQQTGVNAKTDVDISTTPAINKSSYTTAVGIRAGETSGLTFKQHLGSAVAIEGILGVWPDGMSVTGLYEIHVPAFNVQGLRWYYGGGGHVAFETGRIYYYDGRTFRNDVAGLGLGVDGILGIEYKIPPIPFAVSLDMKPFVEVNTAGGAYFHLDPGLGVKVAF